MLKITILQKYQVHRISFTKTERKKSLKCSYRLFFFVEFQFTWNYEQSQLETNSYTYRYTYLEPIIFKTVLCSYWIEHLLFTNFISQNTIKRRAKKNVWRNWILYHFFFHYYHALFIHFKVVFVVVIFTVIQKVISYIFVGIVCVCNCALNGKNIVGNFKKETTKWEKWTTTM